MDGQGDWVYGLLVHIAIDSNGCCDEGSGYPGNSASRRDSAERDTGDNLPRSEKSYWRRELTVIPCIISYSAIDLCHITFQCPRCPHHSCHGHSISLWEHCGSQDVGSLSLFHVDHLRSIA